MTSPQQSPPPAERPLRILLANFHFKGYGQPTVVRLLARALVAGGHDVLVACPPDSELMQRCALEGLATFTGARFKKTNHLLSTACDVRVLRTLLADWKPDIIHTNGSQDTWNLALAKWRGGCRAPHLMTRHNIKPVNLGIANRWLYGKRLAHVVLAAEGVRVRYLPHFAAGTLEPERVTSIHPPFDDRAYAEATDRSAIRRACGIPEGDAIVGVVARLHPFKGHKFLFDAFPAILARAPRARLVVLGDGPEETALKAQAERLGFAGRVHWLGYRRDAPALTAGFDVDVLPAIDGEASPTVVKEAMAVGVACVVSDVGGVREIVDDGVHGFVVPIGDVAAIADRVARLLCDRDLAARLGQAARQRAWSTYSPGPCAQRHVELYRRVIACARAQMLAAP